MRCKSSRWDIYMYLVQTLMYYDLKHSDFFWKKQHLNLKRPCTCVPYIFLGELRKIWMESDKLSSYFMHTFYYFLTYLAIGLTYIAIMCYQICILVYWYMYMYKRKREYVTNAGIWVRKCHIFVVKVHFD